MAQVSKRGYYAEIAGRYPPDWSARQIAEAEGINPRSLSAAFCKYGLRPREKIYAPASNLVLRLVRDLTDQTISAGVVTPETIASWRRGSTDPRLSIFAQVCAANDLILYLGPVRPLEYILGEVNKLRMKDLTGPEVCAILTDMLMDQIDGEMG